jgi:hypothetical protein
VEIAPKRLQRPLAQALRVSPPEALGVTYTQEEER